MGMIAFYAGLLMGVLVGIVFIGLLSKLIISEEVEEMSSGCNELPPMPGGPVELKMP